MTDNPATERQIAELSAQIATLTGLITELNTRLATGLVLTPAPLTAAVPVTDPHDYLSHDHTVPPPHTTGMFARTHKRIHTSKLG